MSLENSVLEFIDGIDYDQLPENVIAAVKRMTFNAIAAIIAGSSNENIVRLSKLACDYSGRLESSIFLQNKKVPITEAALVNAAMARAMDFDDFHMETGMHASATAIPVALAVAESQPPIHGKKYITAVAAGCEIMCRMRNVPEQCIGVSGWTGEIYGVFGAALTAAKLLGLNIQTLQHTQGLALSQSSGTAQAIYDGSGATYLQQGFAARAGLISVLMANLGLTGARHFLTGKAGFYPTYFRGLSYDTSKLIENLGKDYQILNIATKPYPACGFTMAPIENAINILNTNKLKANQIEKIRIRANERMYTTVCHPLENKYHPQTKSDALFSMPYIIATAIINGDVRLEDFSEDVLSDRHRLELMQKIELINDEEMNKEAEKTNSPLGTHAIEIICSDGNKYVNKLNYSTGFPQKPMTLEECANKANKLLSFSSKPLQIENITSLKNAIKELDSLNDINFLLDYIV